MISAKDEFFLEREHLQQLFEMAEASGISQDIAYEVIREIDGEFDVEAILRMMHERNRSPLERVRRGETLSQAEIKKAVKKAANDE